METKTIQWFLADCRASSACRPGKTLLPENNQSLRAMVTIIVQWAMQEIKMKKMLPASLCFGLLCLAADQGAYAGENKPSLKVTAEMGLSKDGPTVKLAVVNDSDTYQIFQSISCSWQEFWQTDDKDAIINGQGACAKNSLYTIVLAPHERHAEAPSLLLLRGKPGKRTLRFGYSRKPSDFSSDALRQIYNSKERLTYFSRISIASHFKPGRETFWSAPITVEATKQSILH